MIVRLFAVLDEKGAIFSSPFTSVAPGMAIRSFEDACKDSQSPYSRHPGDYKLYEIGQYDDNSGLLAATVPPVFLVSGTDVLATKLGVVRDA